MSAMLPDARRAQILNGLAARGIVRIAELSDLLGVAPITIRRDINELAEAGLVRRVHGGAALVEDATRPEPREASAERGAPLTKVGMLVPSLDYYWPDVIAGARAEAASRGVTLLLRGTSYGATDDRAQVEHLIAVGVDGIIQAPDTSLAETSELLDWLRQSGVPVVLIEREAVNSADRMGYESVATDHSIGTRAAVGYLAGFGHRRVGFVANRRSPHAAKIREGWSEAVADFGLARDAVMLEIDRSDDFASDKAVKSLVKACLDDATTALLVHADREAMAIIQYCQRSCIAVPEDLSIVAYDDEVAGLFSPPITAVRSPRTSIGRASVALLAERLADPDRPVHRLRISPKLNIRQSVAQPG